MKTTIIHIINILLVSICYSCSNEIDDKIVQINYGTSFGECVGYCKHELTIKSGSINYECSGWNNQIPTLTFSDSLTVSTWDSVRSNLNLKDFFDLPEVIGCPDCADGGAEWIMIKQTNGESHKVTFEYNNEPVLLKTYILKFREKLSRNQCN
jgi:hypothetical protein